MAQYSTNSTRRILKLLTKYNRLNPLLRRHVTLQLFLAIRERNSATSGLITYQLNWLNSDESVFMEITSSTLPFTFVVSDKGKVLTFTVASSSLPAGFTETAGETYSLKFRLTATAKVDTSFTT